MRRHLAALLGLVLLFAPVSAFGRPPEARLAFTVSIPHPDAHILHVRFRAEGLKGVVRDFEMPAWMPGYYRILDYEKNVSNFRAADGDGHALGWEKVTRNTWRVAAAQSPVVVLDYDVLADIPFVAANFADAGRAFLAPPGIFVYPAGEIRHPVTVTVRLPEGWTRVATGLDPVGGRPGTFFAPDFDVLYDCPLLLGNQETARFEVRGVPHTVVIEDVPDTVDRRRMLADLKRIVETATGLMEAIPYTHYTFLLMGKGNGGIEHANSAACSFNGRGLVDEKGYQGWLSYISHEYFHNFNVKRIRPLALGPFDYETENLTDMLWVSEGLTVYYEDIIMVRAGLMTGDEYLERMEKAMTRFENSPGRRYQSAAESSLETWSSQGLGGGKTKISYYDNGAMLGAMLDLEIRHDSGNRRSLDDVMRQLYRKYAQGLKRGFTDAEFREACEAAAGQPMAEMFAYASTTKDVDYAKYFGYAGLRVVDTAKEAPGAYLGLDTQTADGKLIVTGASSGSPAETAGLRPGDELLELDGRRATADVLSALLTAKKPGDTVKARLSRGGAERDAEIALGKNMKHDYSISRDPGPTPLQAAILKGWLKRPE